MASSPTTNPSASSKNSPAPDATRLIEFARSEGLFLFPRSFLLRELCVLCVNSSGFFPRAAMSNSESQIDVRTALKQGLAQLRDAHVPSFTLAAELLLLHVLGRDRTWLYAHPEEQVSSADAQRYFALIPRPETEHVIEVALDRLAVRERRAGRKQTLTGEGLQIADIGTGSGCIAIALAKELPAATIYATDISSAALAVAQRNANRHCVSDRIHFVECNLLDAFLDRGAIAAEFPAPHKSPVTSHQLPLFDLIASNPPYIGRREAAG